MNGGGVDCWKFIINDFERFLLEIVEVDFWICVFVEDFEGNLWIGIENGFYCCIFGGQVEVLDVESGFEGWCVNMIFVESDGMVWVGMCFGFSWWMVSFNSFMVLKYDINDVIFFFF